MQKGPLHKGLVQGRLHRHGAVLLQRYGDLQHQQGYYSALVLLKAVVTGLSAVAFLTWIEVTGAIHSGVQKGRATGQMRWMMQVVKVEGSIKAGLACSDRRRKTHL